MTGIIRAVSHRTDAKEAIAELAQSFKGQAICHVLFFCSAQYELVALEQAINRHFDGLNVSGCTTAGEISPDGYCQGSITAIGFPEADFGISVGCVKELASFTPSDARDLIDVLKYDCEQQRNVPISQGCFAITLIDGLSIQEEQFLVQLNAALGSCPNFGGSAGDDINLASTHVFHQGRFYQDAAIVLLFSTPYEFEVFTTHHCVPTDEKLVVTDADVASRTVTELDADSPAQIYSQAVGIDLESTCPAQFALHPLAVKLGDDYFIRSIQSVEQENALKFFCAVEAGIVLNVMQRTDLISNIESQYRKLEERLGEPQLIIGFDCFLRRLEAEALNIDQQISNLMVKLGIIGMNTYGEQHQGMHINQTLTGVAIGKRKRAPELA